MAYATYSDVFLHTNLTTNDISNADVTSIITNATVKLNSDINTKVTREFVSPIDNTRENKIDGSNIEFYVQNWSGKYLADMNNDGEITIADVIVRQVTTTGTESTLTVSSVDDDDCKITLSSAPSSGVYLYVDYAYSHVRQLDGSVDNRIKMACVWLTAAYCYAKLNIGRAPSVGFGSTRLTRDMDSYKKYMELYWGEIRGILDQGGIINCAESPHTI